MPSSVLSILILLFVILMSAAQRVNIGLLALAMAWVLGHFVDGGMKPAEVMAGFPVSMFVMLVAISYLFGIAGHNGTLERVTGLMIRSARGKSIFLPLIFFGLAVFLSTVGAGNIGAVALLAPAAMAVAAKTGLGAFFMTVMVIYGANAGTFSPFALTGIVANSLVERSGYTMDPWTDIYWPSLFVQTVIALANYVVFSFLILRKNGRLPALPPEPQVAMHQPFTRHQLMTLAAIAALIIGVVFFKMDVGLLAMCLSVFLTVIGAANGEEEMKSVPWGVVVMVCGVSTLIAVVEKAGGMHILIEGLTRISDPEHITGMLALVVGLVSSFSSSSAVVMPTFIPLVPGLIERMGTGDPVGLISSINIGSHVVDVSPLSTLGAVCLANAAKYENKNKLFRGLLIYGLCMSLVGALTSYLFF